MTEEAAPSYSQLARTIRAVKYELELANAAFTEANEHLQNARRLAEGVIPG